KTSPHLSLRRHHARDRPRRTGRLARARRSRRLLRPGPLRPRLPDVHGADADPVPRPPATVPARTPRPSERRLAAASRLIPTRLATRETPLWVLPEQRREPMGKVVMYSTVSVDGFIADEHDQPGPLFDWLSSGDVPLDETGQLMVSQASYDH